MHGLEQSVWYKYKWHWSKNQTKYAVFQKKNIAFLFIE